MNARIDNLRFPKPIQCIYRQRIVYAFFAGFFCKLNETPITWKTYHMKTCYAFLKVCKAWNTPVNPENPVIPDFQQKFVNPVQ